MKRYLPLAIISAILTVAATAFNTTLLIELFTATEALDRGLGLVVCIILFLYSAGAYLISGILSAIGWILCRRAGNLGMATVYTAGTFLPILLAVASYLILLLA